MSMRSSKSIEKVMQKNDRKSCQKMWPSGDPPGAKIVTGWGTKLWSEKSPKRGQPRLPSWLARTGPSRHPSQATCQESAAAGHDCLAHSSCVAARGQRLSLLANEWSGRSSSSRSKHCFRRASGQHHLRHARGQNFGWRRNELPRSEFVHGLICEKMGTKNGAQCRCAMEWNPSPPDFTFRRTPIACLATLVIESSKKFLDEFTPRVTPRSCVASWVVARLPLQ